MHGNRSPMYALSKQDVLDTLESSVHGLSVHEAQRRLEVYGYNEIPGAKKASHIEVFMRQFKNSIVLLLLVATIISFIFEDTTEAIAILLVILINAIIGYILEIQAERSMEALKKLNMVFAKVIRNNKVQKIQARELVPGDVIELEAGDIVPADARLIELSIIEADESAITGESVPVLKDDVVLPDKEIILADRLNIVFQGTFITKGNARAVIIATGANTEIGDISEMIQQAHEEDIPINTKLNAFSKSLIGLIILIIIPFVVVGIIRNNELYLMIETAIALSVAAIPEGLPIVTTISLANGMLNLADSNVIVKRLAAVETLGETDIIMTDKTGTLTDNHLKVEVMELSNDSNDAFNSFAKVALLCNNASLNDKKEGIGDPVEIALLSFIANKDGKYLEEINNNWTEVGETPFDSQNRYMANLHSSNEGYFVAVKGSPFEVLSLCDYEDGANDTIRLNEERIDYWNRRTHEYAQNGLKVLGFAYRKLDKPIRNYAEGLVFIGLVGFLDPPRPGVQEAILQCQEAGIKIVMVTGDHPETAKAIARQINLVPSGIEVNVIHGRDLYKDRSMEAEDLINNAHIFSRVTPRQKLELAQYFQNQGLVVAMTGDGVNDAPALKKAEIGIAMGARGTQVAEEAADMVLQDDSFSSIVKAIKQGRVIFKNIKNFIIYLLSCNLTEIMVVAIAAFSNVTLPLLPLQILFLNLVTDVFPALALGMGKGEDWIMKQKSRNPNEPILNRNNWVSIITYSLVLTLCILSLYYYSVFYMHHNAVVSNNIAFFTLAFAQLFHPVNLITRENNLFNNEIIRNMHLWFAVAFCAILLCLVYLIPLLSDVLQITRLNFEIWMHIIGVSLVPVLIIRGLKLAKLIE